ncbi:sex peptide receptor-like [Saccostrea cucullata]|uniref:sex peptide receptor-like n=1 Tax=Saccostrea cuccullata TaxID=36930 RepID=UPI002ED1F86B
MTNQPIPNSTFVDLNNTGNATNHDNYGENGYGESGSGGDTYFYNAQDSWDYYSDFYAHKYEIAGEWEVPIRGYLTFFIALITILTNILLICVFIFRSTRSPTTIVLTSLAISDSIICFTKLPEAIYFNMAENYKNLYMTYEWCKANHVLYVIYQICRMTSNWFTAMLGVQRLLAVALPFKYSKLCSNVATAVEIAVIAFVAFLLNLYEAFGTYIAELPVYTSRYYNESLPSSCIRDTSLGLIKAFGDSTKSKMIFFIFSGLLYRVLPVIILIFTTVTLAYFLLKRRKMGAAVAQRKAQTQRMTGLIFLILVVFLIAEIQDGIAYFIYAAELSRNSKRTILSKEDDIMWDTISTLLSLISYACNFWIFFMMSQQFRSALRDIFKSGIRKAHVYLNLEASEVGSSSNVQSTSITGKDVRSTLV